MIIVKITDGIGNQMFQYATAWAVAIEQREGLKVDDSWYDAIKDRFTKRTFLLDKLNVEIKLATEKEIRKIKNPRYIPGINSLYWRHQYSLSYFKRHCFQEKNSFKFDENIFEVPGNCYLQGFFQSYKYFERIKGSLFDGFYPVTTSGKFDDTANAIANERNSVAVHFRLGDYKNTGHMHYCLDRHYYQNAFDQMSSSLGHVKYFIFSDEIDEVKSLFKIENAVYIENDPDNKIDDLFLMSKCRHNIIANSSYSWWGAWLNQNPDKIIIAPRKWFNNKDINTSDLLPEEWIKI